MSSIHSSSTSRYPAQGFPSIPGQLLSKVKFGCRVFAYIAPKGYDGQDQFIKQCLLTGSNSMKRQNQLPLFTAGSEDPKVADLDYHEEVLPQDFAYKAGWGIATKPENSEDGLIVKRSPFPTWQDKTFDQTVVQVAETHPAVVMAHLREARNADKHAEPVEKNAHPFKIGDWAVMQHGSFPEETLAGLNETLTQLHEQDSSSLLPESEVDTERFACYLAEKIRRQTGSTQVKSLPTKQLTQLFQEALTDIIRWPDRKGETHTAEEYPGAFNFVLSDGERVLASRYSPLRPLYLGSHKAASGQAEYILATDKMQPTDDSGLEKIDWALLPNNSITVLERSKKDGSELQATEVTLHKPQTLMTAKMSEEREDE
jgi:predicted glutamine amidotransferase